MKKVLLVKIQIATPSELIKIPKTNNFFGAFDSKITFLTLTVTHYPKSLINRILELFRQTMKILKCHFYQTKNFTWFSYQSVKFNTNCKIHFIQWNENWFFENRFLIHIKFCIFIWKSGCEHFCFNKSDILVFSPSGEIVQ